MRNRRDDTGSSLYARVRGFWKDRRKDREERAIGWEPMHERRYREDEDGELW